MIVASYNAAAAEAIATIHCARADDWERLATRAIAMLRHLAGRGVHYQIRMPGRGRNGFT